MIFPSSGLGWLLSASICANIRAKAAESCFGLMTTRLEHIFEPGIPSPVPHDIGVVGFDNWELFSTTPQPPLTTVDMNLEDMGRAVAEELQEAISVQPRPGRRRPYSAVRSCPANGSYPWNIF